LWLLQHTLAIPANWVSVLRKCGGSSLSALAIEGEKYLRIDYCQLCRAYLKTYDGEGNETLFLADWTSLHLDVIARDRGLKRLASSLYEL
jgi:FdhE protein